MSNTIHRPLKETSTFKIYLLLFKNLVWAKGPLRFFIASLFGLAFSIAVILCTFGLMDGFELSLKKGLKTVTGDATLFDRSGLFSEKKFPYEILVAHGIHEYGAILQVEAFITHDKLSKGILLKGISPESFQRVTGVKLELLPGEIILGQELALILSANIGDTLVLMVANGNQNLAGLPTFVEVKVKGTVKHNVYEKDARMAYISIQYLQNVLNFTDKANMLIFNLPKNGLLNSLAENNFPKKIAEELGENFVGRPFWKEFSGLLEAVKVEKISIGLVLQLIVLIAMFNMVALVIYINEMKAQEIFLFRALGLSSKKVIGFWFSFMMGLCFLSCLLSIVFTKIFNLALGSLSIFKIPGDIYVLTRLELALSVDDYIIVFGGALIWTFTMLLMIIWRYRKQSIIGHLKKEFN